MPIGDDVDDVGEPLEDSDDDDPRPDVEYLRPNLEMHEDDPMPAPPRGYDGYYWVVFVGGMIGIVNDL